MGRKHETENPATEHDSGARDRTFREAEEALVHAIATIVRTQKADPLAFRFVLVHESSPETYRALLRNGGSVAAAGFALGVSERGGLPDDPLAQLPADLIACMISVDDRHKAVGLPLDVLGAGYAGSVTKRPSVIPLPNGDNGLNTAALLRWLWVVDLEEIGNLDVRERIRAWRERVDAVQRACLVMACPPAIDDLLWEHGNGNELERRLKATSPRKPGARTTDIDLFDIILSERFADESAPE